MVKTEVQLTPPELCQEWCGICAALAALPLWKRWWFRIAYGIGPLHHPHVNSGAWTVKP